MPSRDVARSSPSFTAVTLTTVIVVLTIAGLIGVLCVVTSCTRRHHSNTTRRPSPRHLATGPGTTTPTGYSAPAAGYLRSPPPTIDDVRPSSFYQSVCSDAVCPTVKSSWAASTAVPLSELWSASQIGSRTHVPSRAFASRQIQPITLHYYNDF